MAINKRRKPGRRVYLSRDDREHGDDGIEVYLRKPKWHEDSQWWHSKHGKLTSFCYQEFQRVTGFRIKPGECVRGRINFVPE